VTLDQMNMNVHEGISSYTAFLDNSQAFKKYLDKHDIAYALRQSKMKLRDIHRIVPHVSLIHCVLATII
jgi:hypothetical protein